MTRRFRATLLTIAFLSVAGAAQASSVTTPQLRELAQKAGSDPRALEQLDEVTSVDGVPVDMHALLAGTPQEKTARVRSLAGGVAPPPVSGTRVRAKQILEGSKFHAAPIPRPFQGILHRTADGLTRAFNAIAKHIPFHAAGLWALIGALVIGVSVLLARRMIGRRSSLNRYASRLSLSDRAETRAELERRAADAESRGELDLAFRLLFRAALLRLDEAHAIAYKDSLATHDIAKKLRSQTFDALALRFDQVAYGGSRATPEDLTGARDRWPHIVEEAAA